MNWARKIQMGSRSVGEGSPALVIAEIGSNHNQSLSMAIELIDAAADGGADVVKFQSLNFDELHHASHETEEFKSFFKNIELNEDWYHRLTEYSAKKGLMFTSSPTYMKAISILDKCNVPFFKIASAQFGIHPELVIEVANRHKPIVASTGLVLLEDVARQLRLISQTGNKQVVLMHCVSRYPTKPSEVNLRVMTKLSQAFDCLIGFSDHTMSLTLPGTAVALGACVIEKHITMDRDLKGPDHHYSLTPREFCEMVKNIRETEDALKQRDKSDFSIEEQGYIERFVYKCVTGRAIGEGETLDSLELFAKRANGGIDVRLAPLLCEHFVAAHDLEKGKLVTWQDVIHATNKASDN